MKHQVTSFITIIIFAAVVLGACSSEGELNETVRQTEATQPTTIVDDSIEESSESSALPDDMDEDRCTDRNTGASLTYDEALVIAQSSQCLQEGQLKDEHFCNEYTGTWWIDLQAEQPGCNPACVIDVNTSIAEINWRCTGALPPEADQDAPADAEVRPAIELLTVYDYSDWESYYNEQHGYEVKYPPGVQPMWDDEDAAVTFEGPLVDDEHWPVFFLGHGTGDFSHPPEGTPVREWVTAYSGQPGDLFSEETEIAGLPAYHVKHNRSPQAYASDQYYFIKDGQMFSIVILHTGDKQDWQLYNQFLQSFTFPQSGAIKEEGQLVAEWRGIIGVYPPGFQSQYYFDREDGQRWIVGTSDESLWQAIADAAWVGAEVELSGVQMPLPGLINVTEVTVSGQPPAGARNLSSFARPSASSALAANRFGTYHEWSAVDGSPASPWCEGASGSGIGEWLQLDFPAPVEVTMIQMGTGYDHDEELFLKNNRVKRATFIFPSGEEIEWEFEDDRGLQTVPLARAPGPNIMASTIRLVIEEVYPGTVYDDTCISELELWGRPG